MDFSETELQKHDSVMKSDFINKLPLTLIKTETIPSDSASSRSVIDWLPDFAGYAWIAYGASSCLVISHFPSHFSTFEPYIGPIFRHVLEFSAPISAVIWRPGTPSSGGLACASDNCIHLITHDSSTSIGSFSWTQSTMLVQSTSIEAITWSDCGDGIISCGIEVVIWKYNGITWEIKWNMKTGTPQNLVSASWSIKGPSATAFCSKNMKIQDNFEQVSKNVLLFRSDGNSNYFKSDLCHPAPVTWIKWRPLRTEYLKKNATCRERNILLTCCLDGALRLWGEIYNGGNDKKTMSSFFCVIAVIEVNQEIGGSLRDDMFITWATEINGVHNISNCEIEAEKITSLQKFYTEKSGYCEWIVGFGPGLLLTFWSVHCVDDISPDRFPRVMLWKSQKLQWNDTSCHITGNLQSNGKHILLNKVIIYRNHSFGPPTLCSLVHLSPSHSLEWYVLCSKESNIRSASLSEWRRDDELSIHASETLTLYGHNYSLVQVLVHPCSLESEAVAASLDLNGIVLFWSISKNISHNLGLPVLNPAWKLCGSLTCQNTCPKYTRLSWLPSVLNGIFVFFAGHDLGIDCIVARISQTQVACQKLCNIPFYGKIYSSNVRFDISAIVIRQSHQNNCNCIEVLLLSSWMNDFDVISWKLILHSFDISKNNEICCFDSPDFFINKKWSRFEHTFIEKYYVVAIVPCPLQFPESHNVTKVTSFCTIMNDHNNLIPLEHQKTLYNDDQFSGYHPYHMVTGYKDGNLKLWRVDFGQLLSSSCSCLELVGVLDAHDNRITITSITGCGRKVATISKTDPSTSICTLRIWDSLHVYGSGAFVLEDTLHLDSDVVAMNWLTLGNGRFLLGVCLQQEFRIYMARRFGSHDPNHDKSAKIQIWVCTAVSHAPLAISDFVWGPKATIIIVHKYYFSIIGPLLLFMPRKHRSKHMDGCIDNCIVETHVSFSPLKFFHVKGSTCKLRSSINVKMHNNPLIRSSCSSNITLAGDKKEEFEVLSILEAEKMLSGPLPPHHPNTLLLNMYSGNWMQAQIAIQHLYEYVKKISTSRRYGDSVISQLHLSNDANLHGGLTKEEFYGGNHDNFFASAENELFSFSKKNEVSNCSTSLQLSKLHDILKHIEKLYKLADITNEELPKLLAIIDLLIEVNDLNSSVYKNLDDPGRRFWASIRFQQLYFQRRVGRSPMFGELSIDSKLFGWAFHSDFQETLLNFVLPNEYSWEDLRALGVGFWFVDQSLLRKMLEKLARSQYLKKKDPKECTLLYVVLNRLQVLAGLFKVGKNEKDKLMAGFISRNFEFDKNKEAALKNAYVLMGQHQLDLAVAFFLLGGDMTSAVTICSRNLGDEQLALVICRIFEGNGGIVGRDLISKFLLPSAIQRGDYWMESIFQWMLGDYSRAFLCMFGIPVDFSVDPMSFSSRHCYFRDPNVGYYCMTLASKNNFRSAVGGLNAAVLSRWANLMIAYSLNTCGFPLESLKHVSWYPRRIAGISEEEENKSSISNSEILNSLLKPNPGATCNWIHGDVSSNLEVQHKLHLALQYLYPLMMEHPYWSNIDTAHGDVSHLKENEADGVMVKDFWAKLEGSILYFEQKHGLVRAQLINLMWTSLCNNGFFFMGYSLSHHYASQIRTHGDDTVDCEIEYQTTLKKFLIRATDDISCGISRFIVACNMSLFPQMPFSDENEETWLSSLQYCFREFFLQILLLKHFLKMFCGHFDQIFVHRLLGCFSLLEFHSLFALSWLRRSFGVLLSMLRTLNVTCCDENEPCDVDVTSLEKLSLHIKELISLNSVRDGDIISAQVPSPSPYENGVLGTHEDEKFKIIGACLWKRMLRVVKSQISLVFKEMGECDKYKTSRGGVTECDSNSSNYELEQMMEVLTNYLVTTYEHLSKYHSKQLVSFLLQKMENGLPVETLKWLKESGTGYCFPKNNTNMSAYNLLWNICADPALVYGILSHKNVDLIQLSFPKHYRKWVELVEDTRKSCFIHETEAAQEQKVEGNSLDNKHVFDDVKGGFRNRAEKGSFSTLLSAPFESPKEVHRKNGEPFEALCVNSVDHQESVVAGNPKGIFFFRRKDELSFHNYSENVWSEVEWPHNGWGGVEPTPGASLVSKNSTRLGLGGATVAAPTIETRGIDFPASCLSRTPACDSVDSSGFGVDIEGDFNDLVVPPSTVESITALAFSSHSYNPFFLVGSTNTCIYLWKFGSGRAAAIYGADVPSSCAPASVSAVQFDHFGHRFATAASDGTVCTWQLEAGAAGRCNMGPTDSSSCFDKHALDVAYRGSSGSIVAAAGCSSNGANVVIWDTLAPPTSQTSITCHEGGAHSIAVFDNDIGSGSTSSLIITGGRDGDVGLHDLRFVQQNSKDHMLWHIPSAHPGGVTKVSTVPNTSLFLTGGREGDVKLWDVEAEKPVFHWPKLHDRRAFFHPAGSRRFGGNAVTDIRVLPNGFITCGRDGRVKLVRVMNPKSCISEP